MNLCLQAEDCFAYLSSTESDPDPPTTVSPFLERSFGVATVVVSLINVGLRLSQSLGLLWLFLAQTVPSLAAPLSPWLFNGMSLVTARGTEGLRTFTSSPSLTDLPFALLGIGEDGCRRRFMCELAVEKLPPLNKYAEVFSRSIRDPSCSGDSASVLASGGAGRRKRLSGESALGTLSAGAAGMQAVYSLLTGGSDSLMETEQNAPGSQQYEGTFSLSNQVGLKGVNELVSRISNYDRQRFLEEVRTVACDRMDACVQGRDLAEDVGREAAEETVDRDMKYLDSALLGIRGLDCESQYRGCTDFS
ncbi:unnamed protein product [Ixodes persulcatus]